MPVWPDPLGTYGLMIPSGNSTGDMIVDIFDFSSGGSVGLPSQTFSSFNSEHGSGFLVLWVLFAVGVVAWHCFEHFARSYFSWECTNKSEFHRFWHEAEAQYGWIAQAPAKLQFNSW